MLKLVRKVCGSEQIQRFALTFAASPTKSFANADESLSTGRRRARLSFGMPKLVLIRQAANNP
jgi:hypothetical protein